MAPPRQKNPTFPSHGFEKFSVTGTEPSTGKKRTYNDWRPKRGAGYDILTDDVLISGAWTSFAESDPLRTEDQPSKSRKGSGKDEMLPASVSEPQP